MKDSKRPAISQPKQTSVLTIRLFWGILCKKDTYLLTKKKINAKLSFDRVNIVNIRSTKYLFWL